MFFELVVALLEAFKRPEPELIPVVVEFEGDRRARDMKASEWKRSGYRVGSWTDSRGVFVCKGVR